MLFLGLNSAYTFCRKSMLGLKFQELAQKLTAKLEQWQQCCPKLSHWQFSEFLKVVLKLPTNFNEITTLHCSKLEAGKQDKYYEIMSQVAIARGLKFDEKNAILKGSLEYSEVAHNLWISARVI